MNHFLKSQSNLAKLELNRFEKGWAVKLKVDVEGTPPEVIRT